MLNLIFKDLLLNEDLLLLLRSYDDLLLPACKRSSSSSSALGSVASSLLILALLIELEVVIFTIGVKDVDWLLNLGFDLSLHSLGLGSPVPFGHVVEVLGSLGIEDFVCWWMHGCSWKLALSVIVRAWRRGELCWVHERLRLFIDRLVKNVACLRSDTLLQTIYSPLRCELASLFIKAWCVFNGIAKWEKCGHLLLRRLC